MSLRQFVPPPYKAPWSHTPGIEGWLAGSHLFAKIFPTKLELYACEGKKTSKIDQLTFPQLCYSQDWTVFFDTLRQRTTVQGHAKGEFFRYQLEINQEGVFLRSQKDLHYEKGGALSLLKRGEKILLWKGETSTARYNPPRLFLGCNKDPNLDRILHKPDLLEIVPLWYQFGGALSSRLRTPSLLTSCVYAIEHKEEGNIAEALAHYFRAGVKGYFVPKSFDDLYHGFQEPLLPEELPLEEIHGAIHSSIRSLFLRQENSTLFLLPCLPKEWRSGHLLRETLSSLSLISIEWRKGVPRRVLIHATADEDISFVLPHSLHQFSLSILGKRGSCKVLSGNTITLKKGSRYLLDHFS